MIERVFTLNLIQINFLNRDKLPPCHTCRYIIYFILIKVCIYRWIQETEQLSKEKAAEFSGSSFFCYLCCFVLWMSKIQLEKQFSLHPDSCLLYVWPLGYWYIFLPLKIEKKKSRNSIRYGNQNVVSERNTNI